MKELDKATHAAVREINRKLQQQVKNDWEYPPASALPDGVPALAVPDPPISSSVGQVLPSSPSRLPGTRPRMRERYYGTTDDSSEEEAHMIEDMYAFDSPDTVGDELERKTTERKKRKRKDLEDELKYNTGLCFFMRRRNAWTGAVAKEEHEGKVEKAGTEVPKLATSSDSSPLHTPTSVSSNPVPPPGDAMEDLESTAPEKNNTTAVSQWIPPSYAPCFAPPAHPAALTDVLIPLVPPLIPASNPVRASISSRSQSELYGKIVRDSRTPAVPVNLADMTRIIVQGWKDEGNWPPRGSAPEASIAARRQAAMGMGNRVNKPIGARGEEGLLAYHPHLQRGVEGVKRVFRLSGGSHHDHSKEEVALTSPKSPKSPKSPRGSQDLDSAFRSHD